MIVTIGFPLQPPSNRVSLGEPTELGGEDDDADEEDDDEQNSDSTLDCT